MIALRRACPRGRGTPPSRCMTTTVSGCSGSGRRRGDDPVEYVLSGYSGQRPSEELIAAAPVSDTHDIIGVVRAAAPVSSVYGQLLPIWMGMTALGALVLVSAWLLARRLGSVS